MTIDDSFFSKEMCGIEGFLFLSSHTTGVSVRWISHLAVATRCFLHGKDGLVQSRLPRNSAVKASAHGRVAFADLKTLRRYKNNVFDR